MGIRKWVYCLCREFGTSIVGRDRRPENVMVVVAVVYLDRDREVGRSCLRGCDWRQSREVLRITRNRWVGCTHRKLASETPANSDLAGTSDC